MSILSRAIAKCSRHNRSTWTGCVTPAEIVALCEAGAEPNVAGDLSWAEHEMSLGQGRNRWFYFQPRKELLALLEQKGLASRTKA